MINSVAAIPSWVILPVITLVCGMSFIRSRTKTLCAPIAIAANTPATMPCQSRASRTSGPNTRMAAKTASKNASSASIHGSAATRASRAAAECGGRGRGDHKRGDGNELAGNAVVAGDEFGAGDDEAAGDLRREQAEQAQISVAVETTGHQA